MNNLFPISEMLTISNIAYYYANGVSITDACKDIVSQASDCDNREYIYHDVQELYNLMDTNPGRAYELAKRQVISDVGYDIDIVGYDEEQGPIYEISKAF